MQVRVQYVTFQGSTGLVSMELEGLPEWLIEHPGTSITAISPNFPHPEDYSEFRCRREKCLAEFAENILDSLQNYRGI